MLFAGFKHQWFSSGKYRRRLATPLLCRAVKVANASLSTTR
jgi:hypothetical protein